MSEIVFPSTKAGNEVDRAVTAALETIPAQLTTIGSNLDNLKDEIGQKVGRKIDVSFNGSYKDNRLNVIIPSGSVVKSISSVFSTGLYFFYGTNSSEYELVQTCPHILQHDINRIRNRTISGDGEVELEPELLLDEKWGFHININEYNKREGSYDSVSAAYLAIPSFLRIIGANVTYLLADGWHTDVFIGSSISDSDWGNVYNWKEYLTEEDKFYEMVYPQSDENYFVYGYRLDQDGNRVSTGSTANFWCTDYIPLFSKRIFVNGLMSNQYNMAAYCFYDKDKNFISASPVATATTTYNNVYLEDVPDNAKFIRCTTRDTNNSAFVKVRYGLEDSLDREDNLQEQIENIDLNSIQEQVDTLNSAIFESGNYDTSADLSGITNEGFIAPTTHQPRAGALWKWGVINVPFGAKTITFNDLPSAQYSSNVCSYFADKNGDSVGAELLASTYLGVGTVTMDIPSGAATLVFTASKSAVSSYDIEFHVESTAITQQVQENTEDIGQIQEQILPNNEILIPDLIYAVVGTELNIWNDAVALSIDNGLSSPMNYVVGWSCSKGLITGRCFRFTPTSSDVGSHSCTCSIYSTSNHKLIAEKTFTIKVLSMSALNVQKRIVHFGDSLGRYTAEKIYANFNDSNRFSGVAPIMLGTRGSAPHYEAVGGYTWKNYATEGANQYRIQVTGVTSINVGSVYAYSGTEYNIREVNITDGTGNLLLERSLGAAGNIDGVASGVITLVSGSGDSSINFTDSVREPNNPVWDSSLNDGVGGLSFSKYRERLGLGSSEKIDAASFQFGVNESFGTPDLTSILNNYILPLYNAFIADNPNGKFIVGMTMSAGNDADGAGSNYGASRDTWKYLTNTYNFRKMYLEELQNQYPNLIIAPSQLEVDRYYGYAFSTRQISQRTTATEKYHNNFVHPASDGYGQMADALFATYIGVLNE